MNYREIGATGIKVAEIGLGCWTMGGVNWKESVSIGWSNVDEKEIQEAVDYALDHGVNHFDNADVYGNGKAERMLARVLGHRTNQVIIATKVGHFAGTAENSYEPQHIRHQCEQSLVNLKRDYIDLYYFHHGNFGDSDHYLDDAVAIMHKLKDEGKIRSIGLSAYSNEDFVRLVPTIKPDALQGYANAMNDKFVAEGGLVREILEKRGISFVAFSPLAQGILLGKYSAANPPKFEPGDHRANAKKFSRESLEEVEPKIKSLKERFGCSPESLARVALQYLLHYKVTASVIPGFRNLSQVKVNLAAAGRPLAEEEFLFIRGLFGEKSQPGR